MHLSIRRQDSLISSAVTNPSLRDPGGLTEVNYKMVEDQIYQIIIGKNISIIVSQHKVILGKIIG